MPQGAITNFTKITNKKQKALTKKQKVSQEFLKNELNGNFRTEKYSNQNKKPNGGAKKQHGRGREKNLVTGRKNNRNKPKLNNKEKIITEKREQSLGDLGEHNKRFNICVIRDLEGDEKGGGRGLKKFSKK